MKTVIFCLFLLFNFLPSAFAQITVRPHLGFNLSRLNDEPENFDVSARVGSQFGAYVTVGNKIFLQSGLQYTSVGNELVYKQEGQFQGEKTDAVYQGLRIPLYLGWRPNQKDKLVNMRLFAGPSLTWVLNDKSSNENIWGEGRFSDSVWGANVGAGFDLWLFFLDLNFEFGVSDALSDLAIKNNLIALNGGVRLTLGEKD